MMKKLKELPIFDMSLRSKKDKAQTSSVLSARGTSTPVEESPNTSLHTQSDTHPKHQTTR